MPDKWNDDAILMWDPRRENKPKNHAIRATPCNSKRKTSVNDGGSPDTSTAKLIFEPSAAARITISFLNSSRSRPRQSWFIEKTSHAKPTSLDQYGRTLADVLLPDSMNLKHTLVKDGWCWWYRKYAPWDTVTQLVPGKIIH